MKNPLPIIVSILVAIVSYAGVISFLAQSSVQAATSTVRMYVTPSTAGTAVGQTTSVQLRLYKNSASKVDYADARVTFSTANLEVVSISKQGSHFSYSGGLSTAFNNANGTLTAAGQGGELPEVADVLIATVTFKGKVAGSGGISFSAASGAGDMSNGGHLKNVLDSRVGGIINISNPISSGSGGGSTPPSTTAPQPSGPSPASPDVQTPTSNQTQPTERSGTSTTGDTSTPKDVAADIEKTVTKPPVWLQYLLPVAGISGLLGLGGLGVVLYMKRRGSGVTLPPAEGESLGVMPSTENLTSSEGLNADGDVAVETDQSQSEPYDTELPEFSAQQTLTYTAPLAQIDPAPVFDAALAADVSATVDSVADAPDSEDLSPIEQYEPEPIRESSAPPASPVGYQAVTVPALLAADEVVAEEGPLVPPLTAVSPTAPVLSREIAASPLPNVPEQIPVASEPLIAQPIAPAPPVTVAAPAPEFSAPGLSQQFPLQQPEDVLAPAQQSSALEPTGALSMPPQQPGAMPSTLDQSAPTAGKFASEYADLPDMYDLGEQRLRDEGHGELKPVQS